MSLMNLSNPTTATVATSEAKNLTEERKIDSLHQACHNSSTFGKEKPKPKRTRQTCDFETFDPPQAPFGIKSKSIKSPQSRASKERREPLRDRRATFHNTISKSPTKTPQKSSVALARLQGGLENDENAEYPGFEDLDDVSFRGTQVITSTQPYQQVEMGDETTNGDDLDMTI